MGLSLKSHPERIRILSHLGGVLRRFRFYAYIYHWNARKRLCGPVRGLRIDLRVPSIYSKQVGGAKLSENLEDKSFEFKTCNTYPSLVFYMWREALEPLEDNLDK